MLKFKPNLIPNSKVSAPIDLKVVIKNVSDYIISFKKDGCRLELNGEVLGRSMKPVQSELVRDRFARLSTRCKELGIVLEGEFFAPGMRFEEIKRFFKTPNVTDPKHLKKLYKEKDMYNVHGDPSDPIWDTPFDANERKLWELKGNLSKFDQDWPGRTPEWLSTFHPELKIWVFDFFYEANQDATYTARMNWLFRQTDQENGYFYEFRDLIEFGDWYNMPGCPENLTIDSHEKLDALYQDALDKDYEGLVLANKDRTYKMGRSTAKEATIFKMKEDKLEFDGEVLDIEEGTVAIPGAPKTINELGRSVTSKLAEHRMPSGIAKGIVTEYEGHQFTVSFDGYSHEELKEILENKSDYIGRWFKYKGMAPTKNVPRHAHMFRNSWRDEK